MTECFIFQYFSAEQIAINSESSKFFVHGLTQLLFETIRLKTVLAHRDRFACFRISGKEISK